ncbi:hypothetical protein SMICM17S_10618 [Streptomyces microflavus]
MGEAVDVQAGDAGQRPGELGEGDEYVTDGDVGTQPPRGHGARHEPLDGLFEASARGEQVGVVLVEDAGEHRAQGADPFVGGRVHEAAERGERVGLRGDGLFGPQGGAGGDREDDLMGEGGAVGEVPVERGVADARPPRDVVERHVRPELDEHLTGGRDDPLAVAERVGPRSGRTALSCRCGGVGDGVHGGGPPSP